jgi:adenylate kinase
MTAVAISGVGATGKTTIARLLAKRLHYKFLRLDVLAKRKKFLIGYDKERKSWIVDMKRLRKEFAKLKKENRNMVFESLYAHEFPADFIIVLRCNPKILEKRLRKKYSWHTKITENLEAEMLGMITYEAAKHSKKVFEVDTSRKTPSQVVAVITKILSGHGDKYKAGRIDWLK